MDQRVGWVDDVGYVDTGRHELSTQTTCIGSRAGANIEWTFRTQSKLALGKGCGAPPYSWEDIHTYSILYVGQAYTQARACAPEANTGCMYVYVGKSL